MSHFHIIHNSNFNHLILCIFVCIIFWNSFKYLFTQKLMKFIIKKIWNMYGKMTFIYFRIQLKTQNREIEFVLRSVPVVYHNNLGEFYVSQSFIAWELFTKNFLNEIFYQRRFSSFWFWWRWEWEIFWSYANIIKISKFTWNIINDFKN